MRLSIKERHIPEFSDIPPKKEAVYDESGHIKLSFLKKYALRSLEGNIQRIEGQRSRKRLDTDEKAQLDSFKQKAESFRPYVPETAMTDTQFIEMRVNHLMQCPECKAKAAKLRGDLPAGGLPF